MILSLKGTVANPRAYKPWVAGLLGMKAAQAYPCFLIHFLNMVEYKFLKIPVQVLLWGEGGPNQKEDSRC